MPNDMPIKHFGPCKTHRGAYQGPFGAVSSRFAHHKPHLGLSVRQNRDLAVLLGYVARIAIPRARFPVTVPHFVWFRRTQKKN